MNAVQLDVAGSEREATILKNLKLVHSVCQRFRKRASALGLEYEEIVNVGTIGLMKAVDGFDESYGYKFSTYAVPQIEGYIKRTFRDFNPGARFPRSDKDLAFKMNGLEELTPEEIAEKLEVPLHKVKNALEYKQHIFATSIHQSVPGKDGDDMTVEDNLGDVQDLSEIFVQEFIDSLPDRLATVVTGLMNSKTQNEIGKELGVTQTQISRLLMKVRSAYEQFGKGEIGPMTKSPLEQAKELIVSTDLKAREIAEQTGASLPSVRAYVSKFRKKQEEPSSVNNDNDSEYKKAFLDLETLVKEKDGIIGKLEEHIRKLEADVVRKNNDYHEIKGLYDAEKSKVHDVPLHSACDDLESEIASLQEENNLLTALLKRKL